MWLRPDAAPYDGVEVVETALPDLSKAYDISVRVTKEGFDLTTAQFQYLRKPGLPQTSAGEGGLLTGVRVKSDARPHCQQLTCTARAEPSCIHHGWWIPSV